MQLNYEILAGDAVKAQRLFLRRKRPFFFWGFPLYGAAMFLFGLWMIVSASLLEAAPPLAFGVYLTLMPTLVMPLGAKGVWNKTPMLHGPTTLRLSPEGFEIANPLVRALVRGQAVQFILQDSHLWMLFLGPASYYLVPKSAFETPEQLQEFERTMANFVAMNAPKSPIAAP